MKIIAPNCFRQLHIAKYTRIDITNNSRNTLSRIYTIKNTTATMKTNQDSVQFWQSLSLHLWVTKMCTSLQALSTVRDGVQAAMLKGHSVVTINVRQTQAFLCDTEGSYTVAMYRLKPTLSK